MKQNLITDVVQAMLPYLNNAQAEKLQEVLQRSLTHYDVVENDNEKENSVMLLLLQILAVTQSKRFPLWIMIPVSNVQELEI